MKHFYLRDLFWLTLAICVGLSAYQWGRADGTSIIFTKYVDECNSELNVIADLMAFRRTLPPPPPPPAFNNPPIVHLREKGEAVSDLPELLERLKDLYGHGEPIDHDSPIGQLFKVRDEAQKATRP